jgi:transcriptional regulator with XRE-family HTH domain
MSDSGSQRLVRFLETSKTSQTDFATKAGLLASMISHYCNGSRRPGLDAALAIEKASGGEVPATVWSTKSRGKTRRASAA